MNGKLRNMTSVYLTRGEKILLLLRNGGRVANGRWIGSAGGHFEKDELNDARACVLRELNEEIGLTENDLTGLRLRYITLRYTGGEIRQNYYFFAELNGEVDDALCSNEGELRWFLPEETKELTMPVTAGHMLRHWISEGRYTDVIYVGTQGTEAMTFAELPDTP